MTAVLWSSGAPAAEARSGAPVLDRPTTHARTVVLTGRARPRAVVALQVRKGRWATVRKVRAASNGRYRAVVPAPRRALPYRAVSKGRASTVRQVRPPKPPQPPTTPTPPPTTPTPPPTPPAPAPSDACGSRPQRADGSYWECSFVDEFDGSALDRTKWLVQATSYSGMSSGNRDCYVDDGTTVGVSEGTLKVSARRQLAAFTCASPYGSFTTTSTAGTVTTRDRFSQTYGRYEFRARMPQTAGLTGPHSALWLYPERNTYGAWPASGEIDVAEWFSARPANVYPSAHYAGEVVPTTTGTTCAMPTSSTAFHSYVVEWTATRMSFSYDGVVCWSHSWAPTGLVTPKPFDKPFNLVITQVWGSLFNAPTASSPTSATLEVDWVKAWR
ncbi:MULTISPECIES: family 16 glycosylhydrolase [unclassified Nocardioides]|uniref:glycoside hydrolase family 16 protein n=1 Tax=unclassified Nocardioides TaxID=2615069 RepID=UPI00070282E6|nr:MULTISPECIES: glycoside hydrolase family 16 protein [unclassified Nocardioides]KRC59522.1 hypothetical protein ASE19_00335 [Nocardioides sp. Root79]KRC68654.1 hypothetical protein ASE20_17630 [Nocardioides sp. Root240]